MDVFSSLIPRVWLNMEQLTYYISKITFLRVIITVIKYQTPVSLI